MTHLVHSLAAWAVMRGINRHFVGYVLAMAVLLALVVLR
jgi:hypothetical protein